MSKTKDSATTQELTEPLVRYSNFTEEENSLNNN